MALTQGHFQAYDFNRMVVLFTMMNDKIEVPCAISTDAMDRIEGSTRTTPDRREQQFPAIARPDRRTRFAEIS
jgi:Protein of unknown function (DUF1488)